MALLIQGFVVGKTPSTIYCDGSESTRPKLIEVECARGDLMVSIADEVVCLDAESATKLRRMLDDAIETVF